MVEAGASEVSEAKMLEAMDFAHDACRKLCDMQRELAAKVGKAKTEIPLHTTTHAEILEVIRQRFSAMLRSGLQDPDKSSREAGLTLLINQVVGELKGEYPDNIADLKESRRQSGQRASSATSFSPKASGPTGAARPTSARSRAKSACSPVSTARVYLRAARRRF